MNEDNRRRALAEVVIHLDRPVAGMVDAALLVDLMGPDMPEPLAYAEAIHRLLDRGGWGTSRFSYVVCCIAKLRCSQILGL
jgi:hypothetical protein